LKVLFKLSYSYLAYVNSVFIANNRSVMQNNDTYKSLAILRFCFDGKPIKIISGGFEVEADGLDEKFLELTKNIPATRWGFWRKVCTDLFNGKSREKVLDDISVEAVSRFIKDRI